MVPLDLVGPASREDPPVVFIGIECSIQQEMSLRRRHGQTGCARDLPASAPIMPPRGNVGSRGEGIGRLDAVAALAPGPDFHVDVIDKPDPLIGKPLGDGFSGEGIADHSPAVVRRLDDRLGYWRGMFGRGKRPQLLIRLPRRTNRQCKTRIAEIDRELDHPRRGPDQRPIGVRKSHT